MIQLRTNNVLETMIGERNLSAVSKFFKEELDSPSMEVIEIIDDAMEVCYSKVMFHQDEYNMVIDSDMREFLLNKEKAKQCLLDVILVCPEFMPLMWGGETVGVPSDDDEPANAKPSSSEDSKDYLSPWKKVVQKAQAGKGDPVPVNKLAQSKIMRPSEKLNSRMVSAEGSRENAFAKPLDSDEKIPIVTARQDLKSAVKNASALGKAQEGSPEKVKNASSDEKVKKVGSQVKARDASSDEKVKKVGSQVKARDASSDKKMKKVGSQVKARETSSDKKVKKVGSQVKARDVSSDEKASGANSKEKLSKETSDEKIKKSSSQTKAKVIPRKNAPKKASSDEDVEYKKSELKTNKLKLSPAEVN